MAPTSSEQTSSNTPRSRTRRSIALDRSSPSLIASGSKPLLKRKPKISKKVQRREQIEEGETQEFEQGDLWKVKQLLAEEKRSKKQGGIHYLVDWEGFDQDGKPYEPSWEPKENITRAAIEEWEERKEQEQKQPAVDKKRKRSSNIRDDTGSAEQPLSKKVRQEHVEESPDQDLSFAVYPKPGATQAKPVKEIPDSYEQEQNSRSTEQDERGGQGHGSPSFRVEIPQPAGNFDREAYLDVASSQSSVYQGSSQQTVETPYPSQPSVNQSSSQWVTETPAPAQRKQKYHTGKDIDAGIPDSQELAGSESYRPSATDTSRDIESVRNTQNIQETQATQSTGPNAEPHTQGTAEGERGIPQIESLELSQDPIEDSQKTHSENTSHPHSTYSFLAEQFAQGSRTYHSRDGSQAEEGTFPLEDNHTIQLNDQDPSQGNISIEKHTNYRSPYVRSVSEELLESNSRPIASSSSSAEDRGVFITSSPRASRAPSEIRTRPRWEELRPSQEGPVFGSDISSRTPESIEKTGPSSQLRGPNNVSASPTYPSRRESNSPSPSKPFSTKTSGEEFQTQVPFQDQSPSEVEQGFQTQIPQFNNFSQQEESQESQGPTSEAILDSHVPVPISSVPFGINRVPRHRYSSLPVQETAARTQTTNLRQSQSQPREGPSSSLNSFDATWQAAQIRSPLPQLSPQFSSYDPDVSKSPQRAVSQQQDINSTDSQPKDNENSQNSSEVISSQEVSKRAETPTAENLVESIEPASPLPLPPSQLSPKLYNSDSPSKEPSPVRQVVQRLKMSSTSSTPRLSIREQLRLHQEKAAALEQTERTASLSDLDEIPANPSQRQAPLSQLSLREPAAVNVEVDVPSSPVEPVETGSDENDAQIDAQIRPLSEKEYMVPLPMVSWVRDEYKTIVEASRSDMKAFLKAGDTNPILVEKMDTMINQLKGTLSHPSILEVPTSTQATMTVREQARYAEECSTKCLFLRELLTALLESTILVAVFARSGTMLDIIESICKYNDFNYTRPDTSTSLGRIAKGKIRIVLLPTEEYFKYAPITKLQLAIVFDGDMAREQIQSIQGEGAMERMYREALILLSLKVVNSVEHLELCLTEVPGNLERKAMLLNCIESTYHDIGTFSGQAKPALVESVSEVASFIMSRGRGQWPLPPMPFIEGIEDHLLATQSYNTSSHAASPVASPVKRPLDVEDTIESTSLKRQRISPDADVPDFSETNTATVTEAQDMIVKTNALDAGQAVQIESLLATISTLKTQLETKVASENEIRQRNRELDNSVREIVAKQEAVVNEGREFAALKNEALAKSATLSERLETRTAQVAKLKEGKASLDAQLTSARAALSNSEIPQIAEFNKLNDEMRLLQAENEKLKKRLENSQKDVDYMRGNYQNASSGTIEMRQEIMKLREENENLKRKASDNLVLIQQTNAREQSKQLEKKIKQLETQLQEVQRDLERKSEELRLRQIGRRETRGASAPRSPRMGNGTMSPRPTGIDRVLGNSRSRGTSPSAGALPNEGNSTFRGDALSYQTGPSIGRWGPHLHE